MLEDCLIIILVAFLRVWCKNVDMNEQFSIYENVSENILHIEIDNLSLQGQARKTPNVPACRLFFMIWRTQKMFHLWPSFGTCVFLWNFLHVVVVNSPTSMGEIKKNLWYTWQLLRLLLTSVYITYRHLVFWCRSSYPASASFCLSCLTLPMVNEYLRKSYLLIFFTHYL